MLEIGLDAGEWALLECWGAGRQGRSGDGEGQDESLDLHVANSGRCVVGCCGDSVLVGA